ncbi:MAG: hypothetical protein WCG05_04365 [Alphaproteobacteria bacterium]
MSANTFGSFQDPYEANKASCKLLAEKQFPINSVGLFLTLSSNGSGHDLSGNLGSCFLIHPQFALTALHNIISTPNSSFYASFDNLELSMNKNFKFDPTEVKKSTNLIAVEKIFPLSDYKAIKYTRTEIQGSTLIEAIENYIINLSPFLRVKEDTFKIPTDIAVLKLSTPVSREIPLIVLKPLDFIQKKRTILGVGITPHFKFSTGECWHGMEKKAYPAKTNPAPNPFIVKEGNSFVHRPLLQGFVQQIKSLPTASKSYSLFKGKDEIFDPTESRQYHRLITENKMYDELCGPFTMGMSGAPIFIEEGAHFSCVGVVSQTQSISTIGLLANIYEVFSTKIISKIDRIIQDNSDLSFKTRAEKLELLASLKESVARNIELAKPEEALKNIDILISYAKKLPERGY